MNNYKRNIETDLSIAEAIIYTGEATFLLC